MFQIPRTAGAAASPAFLLAGLLMLVASPAWSQAAGRTASVAGVVTDPSGRPVPDVAVEAVVADRIVSTARTGPDGRYVIDVPPGRRLRLHVRRDGFAEHTIDIAGVEGVAIRDVALALGGMSDTVVVTASRGAVPRGAVTESVTVLTAADLAALGASSASDALRAVPGMSPAASGREGALTSVFSRGGESDYTLVLIDGVRVNQSGGAFDFGRVAAGEIERVEVVRGAHSALYGSDAMGAVVQIFTGPGGRSGGARLSGEVQAGSFNTQRAHVHAGGARSRVDYHAGLSVRRTDGAFAGDLPEKDAFGQTSFAGAVGAALGAGTTLRSTLRLSDASGRSVGQLAYTRGDTGTRLDSKDLSWHVSLSHVAGARATGTATVGYFRTETMAADRVADALPGVYAVLRGTPGARFPASPRLVRLVSPAEFSALAARPDALGPQELLAWTPFGIFDFAPFESAMPFRRPSARYQADLLWGGHRLSGGYEYERESNPAAGFEADTHAVFVQQQFAWRDRWFATLGARVDDRRRYGRFVSPRVSAGVYLVPHRAGALSSVRVTAGAGRGMKTPQFGELFTTAFTDGNPDLRPERARGLEAGVEATLMDQRVRAGATVFHNRFRDQVEFRSSGGFGPDGRPDYVNVAGSRAYGAEIEAGLERPVAGLTARVTYTFVASRVTETVSTGAQFQPGQPLLRRPRHSSLLRLAYAAGRLALHADLHVVGERHDSSFLFLTTVPNARLPQPVTTDITVNPGYRVARLAADVRVRDPLTLFAGVENLTNARYEPALGYPALPRALVAGARVALGR